MSIKLQNIVLAHEDKMTFTLRFKGFYYEIYK